MKDPSLLEIWIINTSKTLFVGNGNYKWSPRVDQTDFACLQISLAD